LIHDCLKLIEITRAETMDVNACRWTTKKLIERFCNGNTTGVFQLESTGIREMTVKIGPIASRIWWRS